MKEPPQRVTIRCHECDAVERVAVTTRLTEGIFVERPPGWQECAEHLFCSWRCLEHFAGRMAAAEGEARRRFADKWTQLWGDVDAG